jgi:hypothetical protein
MEPFIQLKITISTRINGQVHCRTEYVTCRYPTFLVISGLHRGGTSALVGEMLVNNLNV